MSGDVEKYADGAMFRAQPMRSNTPKVHLLSMTSDPLGAIAAACRMYEGIPTYSLEEITDEERQRYWDNMQRTHLLAPLEFVDLHFFLEGVNRSFTHQQVRQRTAVYAQESMRFAVKDNMADEATVPPSIVAAGRGMQQDWHSALEQIETWYNYFVANGIPAEDARDILPHATTTRIHYKSNLRNLIQHAGNRLCTQAQFVWRMVFSGIASEIAEYGKYKNDPDEMQPPPESPWEWQFQTIARSNLFRPICYQQGKCPVKADYDRGCTIRGRVDAFTEAGVPSTEWGIGIGRPNVHSSGIETIRTEEWLLDPKAGWVTKGEEDGSSTGREHESPTSGG